MPPARVIPFVGPEAVNDVELIERLLIAQVSRDQELSRLRGRVISSAGFSVRCLLPDEVPGEIQSARAGRVWVFCHTLEASELVRLATSVRGGRPQDKLLLLKGMQQLDQAECLFDASLEASETIDGLLRVVLNLAKRPPAEGTADC